MIKIKDKTLLTCMKNIQEDLLEAGRNNHEHKMMVLEETTALRKVLKNNSINLISAGVLYSYVHSCIENFTQSSYHFPEDIATEIFDEWIYISNWIEAHYQVKNLHGMVSISKIIEPTKEVA